MINKQAEVRKFIAVLRIIRIRKQMTRLCQTIEAAGLSTMELAFARVGCIFRVFQKEWVEALRLRHAKRRWWNKIIGRINHV